MVLAGDEIDVDSLLDDDCKLNYIFPQLEGLCRDSGSDITSWLFGKHGLRNRTKNCLDRAGLTTLEDIQGKRPSELMALTHFGRTSLNDLILNLCIVTTDMTWLTTVADDEESSVIVQSETDLRARYIEKIIRWGLMFYPHLGLEDWTELIRTGSAPLDVMEAWSLFSLEYEESAEGSARSAGVALSRLIVQVDERTLLVLRRRVWALKPQTLEEIGSELGVTRERVRQLQMGAPTHLGVQVGKIDGDPLRNQGLPLLAWLVNWVKTSLPSFISSSGPEWSLIEGMLGMPFEESTKDLLLCGLCGYWISERGWVRQDARGIADGLHTKSERHSLLAKTASDDESAKRREVGIAILEQPGCTVAELASNLALDEEYVTRMIPPHLKKLTVKQAVVEVMWTDSAIFHALRDAQTYEFPLSTHKYGELIQVGEIDGPSVPTIYNRFGSWGAACEAANVEAFPALRNSYESKWTNDDVAGFVLDYLLEPHVNGGFKGYDQWTSIRADAPSSGIVRQRFGSWSKAKRSVLQGIWRSEVTYDTDTLMPYRKNRTTHE